MTEEPNQPIPMPAATFRGFVRRGATQKLKARPQTDDARDIAMSMMEKLRIAKLALDRPDVFPTETVLEALPVLEDDSIALVCAINNLEFSLRRQRDRLRAYRRLTGGAKTIIGKRRRCANDN